MSGVQWCDARNVWIDMQTRKAIRWLERHGFRFMVDFGYQNAVDFKHLQQFLMVFKARQR